MDFDKLANQYVGQVATTYDARREQAPKWANEQACIDRILETLPTGSSIVDIPVGTGRFLATYAKYGLRPTGLDISHNMLEEARAKAVELGLEITLHDADIRKIPADDRAFDTALCVRFLNWVDIAGLEVALRELQRVARTNLIVSIRHYSTLFDVERTPTGVARMVRQLRRRISHRVRPRGITVHEHAKVRNTLDRLGLHVASATCIERRADGTDYVIYHLRKTR